MRVTPCAPPPAAPVAVCSPVFPHRCARVLLGFATGSLAHVTPGHSNRVFSLKFDPDHQDLVVSGGWDNTVQIWDCRAGHAVRAFFGPHVAGDSVDVVDGVVLTGSWRPEDPLETWDLGTGKKIESIAWNQGAAISGEPCLLYASKFSKVCLHPVL